MSEVIEPGEERVRTAIASLLFMHPFFGLIIGKMMLVRNDHMPTMGTDGLHLYYNSKFVQGLKKQELEGVLAHEAMHVALGHPIRGARFMKARGVNWGTKDFNTQKMSTKHMVDIMKMLHAMDHADNNILTEAKKTLPENCLCDPQYKNMAWEEIFQKMPDPKVIEINIPCAGCSGEGDEGGDGESEGQGGGDGEDDKEGNGGGQCKHGHQHGKGKSNGPKACGGLMPYPSNQDDELDQAETNHRVMITQAAQVAKMQGHLPAGIEAYVNQLNSPKVNWAEQLRYHIEIITKNDYCWMRPNRRFVSSGIVMPSLYSKNCGLIVVARDTSGSCCGEGVQEQFASEVSDILSSVNPEKVIVIDCDAEVANVQELEPDDMPFPGLMEFGGGGGTSFAPPFNYVREEGLEPIVMIYLSDFYGAVPTEEPDFPVIWVGEPNADKNFKPHFGTVLYMEP